MTSKQIQDDTSRDTLYRIHQFLIIRQMAKAVLVGASDWRKPFAVVGAAGFLVSILLFVLLKEPVVDAKVTEQRPENSKKLYCSCHNFRSETFWHLLPDRIICFQIDFCNDVQICGTGSSRWHKRCFSCSVVCRKQMAFAIASIAYPVWFISCPYSYQWEPGTILLQWPGGSTGWAVGRFWGVPNLAIWRWKRWQEYRSCDSSVFRNRYCGKWVYDLRRRTVILVCLQGWPLWKLGMGDPDQGPEREHPVSSADTYFNDLQWGLGWFGWVLLC